MLLHRGVSAARSKVSRDFNEGTSSRKQACRPFFPLPFNSYRTRTAPDWRIELAEVFKKPLAPGWGRAFHNDSGVAQIFEDYANASIRLIVDFHGNLKKRRDLSVFLASGIGLLLDGQLQGHCRGVRDFACTLRANMDAAQREANRMINPVMREYMSPAYRLSAAEKGSSPLRPPGAIHPTSGFVLTSRSGWI